MSYKPTSGPGVGSLILLETVTIANQATVDITLPAGYGRYVLHLTDIIPITDDTELWMRYSLVGTPTTFLVGASDYVWRLQNGWRFGGTGVVSDTNSNGDTKVTLTRTTSDRAMGTTAGESLNATVQLDNPDQSTNRVLGRADLNMVDANAEQYTANLFFGLGAVQANNIAAVRFLAETGNLNTGTISLYGVAK